MKILFHLAWLKAGRSVRSGFKAGAASDLFQDYLRRISQFSPCEVAGPFSKSAAAKSGLKIWVCDRGKAKDEITSEDLARLLEKEINNGARELHIMIGGPDGFSRAELEELKPDQKWSFGPLTLPHELAAVVASEQLYRAWTILRRLPYHSGH